uniref:Transient receptor ion channel domain-containing protein n=1 Tax=Strigamia maritima TaxID=126957 RepID=T1J0U2_STRMM
MAVSLDMDFRKMDFSNDEQRLRDCIKGGDIDGLKRFLEESETIVLTNVFDKALQYAMANNNIVIVTLLSEMKTYQASTMTLKLAASLNYHHAFNVMLKNRTDMNHNKEISTLLIAALESDNIDGVEMLEQMRIMRRARMLRRADEIDGPVSPQSIFQSQKGLAEELTGSHNSLRNAHDRINFYKICANPLYIILYELDPINAAIDTSNDLLSLAHRFPANKIEFTKISLNCKQLAVDLLDCCEDDQEVDDLLNVGKSCGISRQGRLFRYFRIKNIMYVTNQSNDTDVTITDNDDEEQAVFTSYISTLKVLFWVIFGYGEPNNIEIPTSNRWNQTEAASVLQMKQNFIMVIGYTMWAIFHIAFVIVLLNMLIAIMTTSYESINRNTDMNWKFARTRLWMYFIEDNNIVPPPFNVLHYLSKIVTFLHQKVRCQSKRQKHAQNSKAEKEAAKQCANEAMRKYQETLSTLIERYQSKKFEKSVLKDQCHIESVSYVEVRRQLLKDKIYFEATNL